MFTVDNHIAKFKTFHRKNGISIYKFVPTKGGTNWTRQTVITNENCPYFLRGLLHLPIGTEFIGEYNPDTGIKSIYEMR